VGTSTMGRANSDLSEFGVPRERLRRYSSQHQRRWKLASRIAVSIPLSLSYSVDVRARHPAWHSATERYIFTGHNRHHSSISKEVPGTERRCHASSCSMDALKYSSVYLLRISRTPRHLLVFTNCVVVSVLICRHSLMWLDWHYMFGNFIDSFTLLVPTG